MRLSASGGLCLWVVLASCSVVLAKCDPTADPDKSDIANARAAIAASCDCAGAASHGAYVSCAVQQANATLVNKGCAGAVKRCAARSTCGKPGAVTCCVTKTTGTKCTIKRDAGHCTGGAGGTACVGNYASCCDACSSTGCVTTTTTTTIPVCGDGVVNQPSEQCDGTAGLGTASCPLPSPVAGCFPPGSSEECTCCTNGDRCQAFGTTLRCCDPEASCRFLGPGTFGGVCYDPTCGPGDDCAVGQACVGGTCCLPTLGSVCFFAPSGDSIPCCPPAVCGPVSGGGVCCLPGGETCGTVSQCCSGSCTAGVCGS